MKQNPRRIWMIVAIVCVVLILAGLILSSPKYPVALIRVVDKAGQPVAGAVVKPEGLRTKEGPYVSGWYGWDAKASGAPNDPATTDKDGYVRLPYPKYVFERIETGTLCLSVNHPDFVADRPERVVTTFPPAGTPLRIWANYILDRLQHKTILAQSKPIVLEKGAILKLSVRADSDGPRETPLFAQVSEDTAPDTNYWTRPKPGMLVTRRLAGGPRAIRAIRFDAQGWAWFSDVTNIIAMIGRTNEIVVNLKRGAAIHGQLDAATPRLITNGRVVAQVWPFGCKPKDNPPIWHTWATVAKDGSFEMGSLPEGNLEIVVLCDGYVSTNGPGTSGMHYPQKFVLGTNDLTVTIGMTPTARLEVHVTDDKGKPLKDASVSTWPNVRYGEWCATILASDLYKTADMLSMDPSKMADLWRHEVSDFEGTTDSSGVAILANLPLEVKDFNVEHPRFALPAVTGPWGKRREAAVKLIAGTTNKIWVQLEPMGKTPIAHY